jgi:hypothetical protein
MQWSDIQFKPTDKTLRQFAALALIVFGGMALFELLVRHRSTAALIYGALALGIGPLGLAVPQAIRPVWVGWSVVAFPIGWTVTQVMLLVLYFLLFTPIALIFRLIGRDALRLRKPSTASYWQPRDVDRDPRSYFRQS